MQRVTQRLTADDAGSTLVELLVVMVILGVVGAVAVSGSVSGMRATTHAQARVEALVETQTVVERVGRELRAADGLAALEPGRADLDVVRADRRIRFVYTVDGADLVERREDYTSAAALEPDFDVAANDADTVSERVLLGGLANADVFTVFGGEGRTLDLDGDDQLRDVRRVTLRVVRDVGTDSERPPIEVETTVWPRNAEHLDA